MAKPTALNFPPGLQRDGTRVNSDTAIEALWTRWRLARPRKIKGFQEITHLLKGIPRRVHEFYQGSQTIIHVGTSKSLEQVVIDRNGDVISMADRTPATFAGGLNVGWTLDALFDSTSTDVTLIAHSQPDITLVAGTAKTPIFSGLITDTTPLTPLPGPTTTDGGDYTSPSVAGGIVCIQPYLFDYDSDGFIGWSPPNLPNGLGVVGGTGGAGRARVSAQKIIAGTPIRGGGGNSPAGLFWSLSEVIQASFVGQDNGIFKFNTVSSQSSILAGATVIEYDSLFYWVGVNRFLVYNGTVVEVPNSFNQDFFFDNLNQAHAGKSFAFKVPRFGEIWFCAPLFGATEPNYAVIYNVREKCWYDTLLPNGGRTCGYFAQGFPYPVMGSPLPTRIPDNPPGYSLWLHEKGLNEVVPGSPPLPIRSFVETPFVGGPRNSPPTDKGISFQRLEADIQQQGDMVVWVAGSSNARGGDYASDAALLKANPTTPAEQLIGFKTSRRLGRLHFESNTLNGDYIMGRSVIHVDETDEHKVGGTGVPLTSPTLPSGASPTPPLTESDTPLADYLPTP